MSVSSAIHSSEWEIDSTRNHALHASGLTVQLDRGLSLNILGLQNLAGTPWAAKANTLVEQGISLLEGGGAA